MAQVVFTDHTQIWLSSEGRVVTYLEAHGARQSYILDDIVADPKPEVARRLQYTKEILYQLINGPASHAV